MTSYGFVIDNRNCIGCHACSVACKSENEVPLGVYRTWVKYVETGIFPDTRRHFQVTRCNHCANPPCVRICPVSAMYQRSDGIVDFDPKVCIGCKACLQACPYDAIYMDPETNAAAKCHYCAHRTALNLEPACVVVCPTHAIISGDLDDPASEISRHVARFPVTVRKPEQGTAPKLFYIEADDYALTPTALAARSSFMWADMVDERFDGAHPMGGSGQQGLGAGGGPISIGGRHVDTLARVGYNAQHKVPWHWQVPAYLVTKGIAAGIVIYLAWVEAFSLYVTGSHAVPLFLSLVFTGLTTLLLVADLEKPHMFLTILTRPQWRSWLTRGAFVLIAFALWSGAWLMVEFAPLAGWIPAELGMFDPSGDIRLRTRPFFALIGLILALLTAIYTAFLFAQAEGRDLWQSPLLPFHFLIQAIVAGSAVICVVQLFFPVESNGAHYAPLLLFFSLVLNLFVTLVGEFAVPHASEVAARAAHAIKRGKYARLFWGGAVVLGHIVPIVLFVLIPNLLLPSWVLGIVALAALIGLYCYEYAFVMAPQEVPNS